MFGELSPRNIALDLLIIEREFSRHLIREDLDISDFKLETFDQVWGNTCGGFEGIGGAAMTTQRTYVFHSTKNQCVVFFGSRFAYMVPNSEKFMQDVKDENVAGVGSYKSVYL